MVYLLVPFRNFNYYLPAQDGSASIKKVLPALVGKSYADLEIGQGDDASIWYLDITFGDVPAAEKAKIRKELELYCGQDTEGMVWIVRELNNLRREKAK